MLFEQRFWPLIADGSVTVTFRRWTLGLPVGYRLSPRGEAYLRTRPATRPERAR